MQAASFEEWWRRTSGLAGPLSSVLAMLPQDAAEALQARARAAAVPFTTAEGLAFDGVALVASATKP